MRRLALSLYALLACLSEPVPVAGSQALIALSAEVPAACPAETTSIACDARAADDLARTCRERLRAVGAACLATDTCFTTYRPERLGACRAGSTYPDRASCTAPVEDDCAFYRGCMEAARPCGAEGYALAYGERLCHAFVARRGEFTAAGQAWLRGVRTCLQRALVPLLADASRRCADLEDAAYASHTGCYTAPENSLCALPPQDLAALTRALAPWLRDPRAQRQIGEVLRSCSPPSDAGVRAN